MQTLNGSLFRNLTCHLMDSSLYICLSVSQAVVGVTVQLCLRGAASETLPYSHEETVLSKCVLPSDDSVRRV